MIIGLSRTKKKVFLTVRVEGEKAPMFFQIDLAEEGSGEGGEAGLFWDSADETIKRMLRDSKSIFVSVPAAICMTKRMELDDKLYVQQPDYTRWLAGIQLPGDQSNYRYGFIPIMKSYDGARTWAVFYAGSRGEFERFSRALLGDRPSGKIVMIPEQIALAEVLRESLGKDDISQAAIFNIAGDYAVAVLMKDNGFYHSRLFRYRPDGAEELAVDLETYLLSHKSPEEPLPLVITGATDMISTGWNPVIPVFLKMKDLDYAISWGISEFIVAGGRCELPAAS
jgi:hypothetical protein